MNDALNKLSLRLSELLLPLNDKLSREIRDIMEDVVELNVKAVKNLQLLETNAWRLRKGDLIFDPSHHTLHKVKFAERRADCQFDIVPDNREMLVMYEGEDDGDYFKLSDTITLLIDVGEIVHLNKRVLEELPEEDY